MDKDEFSFPYLGYTQYKVKSFKEGLKRYSGDEWKECLVSEVDFNSKEWQKPKMKLSKESTYIHEDKAFRFIDGYFQTLYLAGLGDRKPEKLFEEIKGNIPPIETNEEVDFNIHFEGISKRGGNWFEGQSIANEILKQHNTRFGYDWEGEMKYEILCPNMRWRYFFKDAYKRLQTLQKIHKKIIELQEKAIPVAIASFLKVGEKDV